MTRRNRCLSPSDAEPRLAAEVVSHRFHPEHSQRLAAWGEALMAGRGITGTFRNGRFDVRRFVPHVLDRSGAVVLVVAADAELKPRALIAAVLPTAEDP